MKQFLQNTKVIHFMEISIIIVNYKTPKLTKACVESIKKNPPKVPYEIIVIDNSKNNIGFAAGNNKGIRKAMGKYILLLNSDTEVKKGAIDKLYEFAKGHPDAGAVVPKLLNPDGSTQPSCFRLPTLWLTIRQYWFGEKGLLDKYVPAISHQSSAIVEEAVMAAYLITPTALKKVGLLDERYFFYFEDFDYARRIKNARLKIYYLSDPEVVHHHGASGKNLVGWENQWRRLIPGSKVYHGFLGHHIIRIAMWISQKWEKLISKG